MARPQNVLFLCTGNSARSVLAEAILNRTGGGRFVAYSAGSRPKGQVHSQTLRLLDRLGYPIDRLRSKSWNEFVVSGGPAFDHVITVCNNAAGETCPRFPGNFTKQHWDIPDPAATVGSPEKVEAAFIAAYDMLSEHIRAFVAGESSAKA